MKINCILFQLTPRVDLSLHNRTRVFRCLLSLIFCLCGLAAFIVESEKLFFALERQGGKSFQISFFMNQKKKMREHNFVLYNSVLESVFNCFNFLAIIYVELIFRDKPTHFLKAGIDAL